MPMNPEDPVTFDKSDLRERLDPIAYQVTQEKGTERPFTNKYYKHYEKGIYTCVVCGEDLFDSDTKYESGSGWPAFYDVIDKAKFTFRADASGVGANLLRIVHNPHLIRTEVSCKKCRSHLGHVFKDGPKPTGQRYCINSSSLNFRPHDEEDDEEEEVVQEGEGTEGTDEVDKSEDDVSDAKGETEEKAVKKAKSKSKKPKEILTFLATINGCGSEGFCSIKSAKAAVKKRVEEERKSSPVDNDKEQSVG